MGEGRFPSEDPWGRKFDASYQPQRWKVAGSLLAGGWRGCLSGVQADQDYLKKVFDLQRFSVSVPMQRCPKEATCTEAAATTAWPPKMAQMSCFTRLLVITLATVRRRSFVGRF